MKRMLSLMVVFAFLIGMAAPVMAADLPHQVDKVVSGMTDVVMSPVEIVDHTKTSMDDSGHMILGFFKGLVESPFHVIKKAGGGLINVLTFPVK